MTIEDIMFAFVLAGVVFGLVYWLLYKRYRNVTAKYEVVANTKSVTLQTHVSDQLHRKNHGLSGAKISGHNQREHTARVKRIQHL